MGDTLQTWPGFGDVALRHPLLDFPGSLDENLPTMQETCVQPLGGEDPLEEGMATLQYSCLEDPMDRGAWQATVHGVAKSWTWLSHFHFQLNFTNFFKLISLSSFS